VGAGAVGCYFGGMLARAGNPVTLIGRAHHVEAICAYGLRFEGIHFQGAIPVDASTDLAAAREAAVVLLCVKTLDTEKVMRAVAPHLAGGALVVSLQNGVDNAERIRAATGIPAVPAVVYVAAEMSAPGTVKHNGRGDLILGPAGDRLVELFSAAGVPCRVSQDIAAELWNKLIMNCAYNAMSALARARYHRLVENPLTLDVMRQIVDEAVAVAGGLGVRLSADALFASARNLGHAMSGALSSTAQDLMRGKRTEIDSLNGYVVRRSAESGIPTPVNQTLHALVKLLEEKP
jgi:2-dehydropantoate 2-reductase